MPTLKDLRAASQLSQTELANASGVSLETIKKIETGKVERPHPATLRLLAAVLGQVPVVMNDSRGGPVFDTGMFDNARRTEAGCLCVVANPEVGISSGFVPLRQTTLTGNIVGPLARLKLAQRFSYRRAECDRALEAVYRFPLPGDAAVTDVLVHFGEVTVQTRLVERGEAERDYAAAREQGRQAALATREAADVFTLQVTGLQPDMDVVVETCFVLAAAGVGVGWQLRMPLTIGPRYSRRDEAESAAAHGQPLQVWRDPKHRFSADLRLCGAGRVSSPSHPLTSVDPQRVILRDTLPDRDFVLNWEPLLQATRPDLDVISYEDWSEGERYFLALVTPPAQSACLPTLDRDVVLLVDRSGSMAGPKWEACRWAARRFLSGLQPTERFNLGLFESQCTWLAPTSVPGTSEQRERALRFLEGHPPQGGTELGIALEQALRSERAPGNTARHVLIVTDAQVTDEARILQLLEAESERQDRRRVSVISIDSAPRSAFVRSLVETAGGEVAFLTSDPHQEDITSALDRLLETWARPLATNVELVVETSSHGRTTRSRMPLGDMQAGRSLWVNGGLSLFSEPLVKLRIDGNVVAEQVLSLDQSATEWTEVRALFGARQIARLERLESQTLDVEARNAILDELGYANDPLRASGPHPIYAENAPEQGSLVHRLLVRESLRFGLVCSATGFIGERVEAGRRVEARVQVPSALPESWSDAFVTAAAPPMVARKRFVQARLAPEASAAPFAYQRGPDSPPLPVPPPAAAMPAVLVLRFRGTPSPRNGEAMLVEGIVGRGVAERLSRLSVSIDNSNAIDESAELWLWVDEPLVRIKLRELVLLGGERPLNVAIPHGATLRVILRLEAWPRSAGELSLELA
jgi:Ca-activated chloride channel family protein